MARKYDIAYDEMSKIMLQIAGHESIMYRLESEGKKKDAEPAK